MSGGHPPGGELLLKASIDSTIACGVVWVWRIRQPGLVLPLLELVLIQPVGICPRMVFVPDAVYVQCPTSRNGLLAMNLLKWEEAKYVGAVRQVPEPESMSSDLSSSIFRILQQITRSFLPVSPFLLNWG